KSSPRRSAPDTLAVHAGEPRPKAHDSLTTPIICAATYSFESTDELCRYFDGKYEREEYGRYGNPTVRTAEQKIAALDGAEGTALFASGMAAFTSTLLALLKTDFRGVLGGVLDPHAAYLLQRGIKTLALRVRQQNESALRIARWLESHRRIERVHYPLLESHPDYLIARSQMTGGGGVISFEVKG